MPSTEVIS